MCFCSVASFVVGGLLLFLGIVTLFVVIFKKSIYLLPLALVPIMFGIQQVSEGFVWKNIQNENAIKVFTFFAYAFYPFWIPAAFLVAEFRENAPKSLLRLIWLGLNSILGLVILIYDSTTMWPIKARIQGHHILYGVGKSTAYVVSPHNWSIGDVFVIALYVYLIISSALLTSLRGGRILGLVTLVTFIIAVTVFSQTWTSVWCFFEAIVSIIIIYMIFANT